MKASLLVGISGKKQSGKTTLTTHLMEKLNEGQSPCNLTNDTIPDLCFSFSFADALKQLVCKQVMGLTEDQVNGCDDDKNSFTKYSWEKLPMELRQRYSKTVEDVIVSQGFNEIGEEIEFCQRVHVPRAGKMTAREVMQVVGTDLFRSHFSENIWVDATMRAICKAGCSVAIISDVRFRSEVDGIMENNGYLIRLQRKVSDDPHPSECDLDNYDFNSLGNRCLTLDADIDILTMLKQGLEFVESKR